MQPRNQYSDSFDQLVADTLRDQMGPAPVHEVWEGVRRQIVSPAAMTPPAPTRPESVSWLQRLLKLGFQTPLARGALTVALFGFILLVQPELEELWRPSSPDVMEMPTTEETTSWSVVHDVAFERLIEEDGKWTVGVSQPQAGLSLQPVSNPAELHGHVRPDRPVLLSAGSRPESVSLSPRLALAGGARQ